MFYNIFQFFSTFLCGKNFFALLCTNFCDNQLNEDNEIFKKTLIESLKGGSLRAFNIIYELYARKLLNYISAATPTPEDAEEIVQDIFVSLWNHRDSVDSSKSLSTYLFSIAYRRRIDAFRKAVKAPIYEDYLEYQDQLPADDKNITNYQEFLSDFKRALNRIPSKPRQMIVLSRIGGLSNQEIADRINVSEKTVRNGLSTGLKLLRAELSAIIGRKI